MDELIQLMRAWTVRARLQTSLRWLFLCLAGGLGVALAVSILARLFPLLSTDVTIIVAFACALASVAVAALGPQILTARRAPSEWARQFDRQFRLKERMSTAFELSNGVVATQNERMRMRQLNDAVQTASHLNMRTLLPLRVSIRHLLYSLAIGVALLFTLALPNPQNDVLVERARMQGILAEQRQQIEEIKQQVQQSNTLTDVQKRDITQSLSDAQQALSDSSGSTEKALSAINDAQAKLDAVRDQAYPEQSNALQRAGQSMSPDQLTNPLANSLEKGDFKLAAEQMRNLNQQNGQPLTEQQRQRVADQLEQMARGMQDSSPQTAQQLNEAAQKMRAGDTQAAQEALNKVANTLEQAGEKSAAEQQVDMVQERIEDARRSVSENQQPSNSAMAQLDQSQTGAQKQSNTQTQQGSTAGSQSSEQGQSASGAEASSNSGDSAGSSASGRRDDTGTDNSIYAPDRITVGGENVAVQSENGQNAPNPSANTNQGTNSGATVPYEAVYSQYAKTADEAIQSGDVPAGLRDYVHDYFSSLDPQQRR